MANSQAGYYRFGQWVPGADGAGPSAAQQYDLKKQQLQSMEKAGNSGIGSNDWAGQNARLKQRNDLALQVGQLGGAASGGGEDPTAANRKKALDLTEGRGDATMNDPRITAALDMIQKQMGEGPYSAQVVNQQANRQADRTATMAGQQAQSLRDQLAARGGNPNDPSFQAAMRNADSGRMQQNNADRGDLESNATLQNYSAQNAAANQLANQRMSQLGQANGQYNQAANLYANEQFSGGHQNSYSNTGGTSYSTKSQGLGYTPPTYGNGGQQFTYEGDQPPQPSPQPAYGVPGIHPTAPKPKTNNRGPGYTNLMTGQTMVNGQVATAESAQYPESNRSPFVYKPLRY